jgi:hypothetical protein
MKSHLKLRCIDDKLCKSYWQGWQVWSSEQYCSYVYDHVTMSGKTIPLKREYTVHSKCINDQTLRSDIFLPTDFE